MTKHISLVKTTIFFLILVFTLTSCNGSQDTSSVTDTTSDKIVNAEEIPTKPPYIYPDNTVFLGIDLSDLTEEEAIDVINNSLDDIYSKTVKISGNNQYEYTLKDLGLSDIDPNLVADMLKNDDVLYTYAYNTDFLNNIINTIDEAESIQPINASFYYEPNSTEDLQDDFITIKGSKGQLVDKEALRSDLEKFMINPEEDQITLKFNDVDPEFTSKDMNFKKSILGSQVTEYKGEGNRTQNLRTASNNLSGSVIYPGEEFSTNKAFKSRVAQNGYVDAPVIIDGGLVDGMGGGICQISSTLYCAVVYSELDVVERRNHSLKVGYLPYAYDCTLSEGYIDFRFINNTDYPILINSTVENGKVTVQIFGYDSRPENRTIKLRNEFVEEYPPKEKEIIEDNTLPLGETIVEVQELPGSKYYLYKDIYIDGEYSKSEFVNESKYRSRSGVERVGTGDPLPTDPPKDTEINTDNDFIDGTDDDFIDGPIISEPPKIPKPTENNNIEPIMPEPTNTPNPDIGISYGIPTISPSDIN